MFGKVFVLAFICTSALGAVVTPVDKDDGPLILADAESGHVVNWTYTLCFDIHLDLRTAYRCRTYTTMQAYRGAEKLPLDDADDTLDAFVKASGNFMDEMGRGAGQMEPADKPRAIVHQQV